MTIKSPNGDTTTQQLLTFRSKSSSLQLTDTSFNSLQSSAPVDYHPEISSVNKSAFKLLHYNGLPNWLKENPYILSGYRIPMPSVRACLSSVFRIHTETGNIWTHIIGALIYISFAVYVLYLCSDCVGHGLDEKLVYLSFFVSVIICFVLSVTYHTMLCHSENVCLIFLRLDFVGIIVNITGHYIPYLWYGMHCMPTARAIYSTITILLALLTIVVLLSDSLSQPNYRMLRTAVFISFAAFSLIPIFHFLSIYSIEFISSDDRLWGALMCLTSIMGIHLTGAIIYCTRVPERFFPGKCDLWLNSHQLFHTVVIIAVIVHYKGFTMLADYVRQHQDLFCAQLYEHN